MSLSANCASTSKELLGLSRAIRSTDGPNSTMDLRICCTYHPRPFVSSPYWLRNAFTVKELGLLPFQECRYRYVFGGSCTHSRFCTIARKADVRDVLTDNFKVYCPNVGAGAGRLSSMVWAPFRCTRWSTKGRFFSSLSTYNLNGTKLIACISTRAAGKSATFCFN